MSRYVELVSGIIMFCMYTHSESSLNISSLVMDELRLAATTQTLGTQG